MKKCPKSHRKKKDMQITLKINYFTSLVRLVNTQKVSNSRVGGKWINLSRTQFRNFFKRL